MKTQQYILAGNAPVAASLPPPRDDADLCLVFGTLQGIERPALAEALRRSFPNAAIAGCSTSGEITRAGALDGTIVVTTLSFASTRAVTRFVSSGDDADSGERLGTLLQATDLSAILLFVEGLHHRVQDVLDGLSRALPPSVPIIGGLAGDDARLERTRLLDETGIHGDGILGVGLYGSDLHVASAAESGWRPFGKERFVTRSERQVVYEIDSKPALGIYASYLGEEAHNLPGAALVFPMSIRTPGGKSAIIRSIWNVDLEVGSITFFGDVPEGSVLRLMTATDADLVHGARQAVEQAFARFPHVPEAALLFSCIGRKALMRSATDLEIAAVVDRLPARTVVAGFHTYGEICASGGGGGGEHHNQTMTLLLMSEGIGPDA